MGGFFGVAAKTDCILDLFYGVDYHSHLGTRRGGMATFGKAVFTVRFIILRTLRFVQSLSGMSRK